MNYTVPKSSTTMYRKSKLVPFCLISRCTVPVPRDPKTNINMK
jgi:hypothetical protein